MVGLSLALLFCGTITKSFGSADSTAANPGVKTVDEESDLYRARSLDGVSLEAVESHPNPKNSAIGIGLGLYPFNGYYNALLINVTYLNRLSRKWQWEVVNFSYAYTFDKDLLTELADRFSVKPDRAIDRTEFLASTNLLRTLSYGKFIVLDDHIRYFQTSLVVGAGILKGSQKSSGTANFGFRVEVFTNDRFSWRLDVRDHMTIGEFDHKANFILSTGYGF
ncbi:MAG: hypothetical protein H7301_03885 [Cryobacterium sp.]|nr:hypothetical protein [Oligoflexia bacterium]